SATRSKSCSSVSPLLKSHARQFELELRGLVVGREVEAERGRRDFVRLYLNVAREGLLADDLAFEVESGGVEFEAGDGAPREVAHGRLQRHDVVAERVRADGRVLVRLELDYELVVRGEARLAGSHRAREPLLARTRRGSRHEVSQPRDKKRRDDSDG